MQLLLEGDLKVGQGKTRFVFLTSSIAGLKLLGRFILIGIIIWPGYFAGEAVHTHKELADATRCRGAGSLQAQHGLKVRGVGCSPLMSENNRFW